MWSLSCLCYQSHVKYSIWWIIWPSGDPIHNTTCNTTPIPVCLYSLSQSNQCVSGSCSSRSEMLICAWDRSFNRKWGLKNKAKWSKMQLNSVFSCGFSHVVRNFTAADRQRGGRSGSLECGWPSSGSSSWYLRRRACIFTPTPRRWSRTWACPGSSELWRGWAGLRAPTPV